MMSQRLKQCEIEAASCNRGNRCNATRFFCQPGKSSPHRLGRGPRDAEMLERAGMPRAICALKVARDEQRLEHFLDEERISLGKAMQCCREWRSECDLH